MKVTMKKMKRKTYNKNRKSPLTLIKIINKNLMVIISIDSVTIITIMKRTKKVNPKKKMMKTMKLSKITNNIKKSKLNKQKRVFYEEVKVNHLFLKNPANFNKRK